MTWELSFSRLTTHRVLYREVKAREVEGGKYQFDMQYQQRPTSLTHCIHIKTDTYGYEDGEVVALTCW